MRFVLQLLGCPSNVLFVVSERQHGFDGGVLGILDKGCVEDQCVNMVMWSNLVLEDLELSVFS